MNLRPLIIFTLCLLTLGVADLRAQSGMEFSEFKRKIEPYFAEELIDDLRNTMPQGAQFRIWGWDVGDFSGDGFYDIAFSVNVLGTRKRECVVYLYIDDDGFLVNIARYPLQYVDLPLEIGVVIKEGACFITQKRKSEAWSIRGYQYREGAVVHFDEFVSDRVETYGHEAYRNFRDLTTKERFVGPKDEAVFETEYLTIPAYRRGRQIYAGYASNLTVGAIANVHDGAFFWTGPSDGSFSAKTVYDDDYLYLRIDVTDSTVVTGWCDTCAADRFEIWIDATPPDPKTGSRYVLNQGDGRLGFRTQSDSGLYAFSIRIGDFADLRPTIKVRTTDDLEPEQQAAVQAVRVVSALRSDGYVIKVRIPFVLLGYDRAPVDEASITELGCTLAMFDVDNEFRPDEASLIATSPIGVMNPASYGAIRFVPDGKWYGETTNIFVDAVMSYLHELGF
ncbi:MAG: hypothetical protein FGM24_05740 [Candidatus Kapabacteria bacterium]|nr:hypothetical protein [Candidatus Kapabacteria bacterium]